MGREVVCRVCFSTYPPRRSRWQRERLFRESFHGAYLRASAGRPEHPRPAGTRRRTAADPSGERAMPSRIRSHGIPPVTRAADGLGCPVRRTDCPGVGRQSAAGPTADAAARPAEKHQGARNLIERLAQAARGDPSHRTWPRRRASRHPARGRRGAAVGAAPRRDARLSVRRCSAGVRCSRLDELDSQI